MAPLCVSAEEKSAPDELIQQILSEVIDTKANQANDEIDNILRSYSLDVDEENENTQEGEEAQPRRSSGLDPRERREIVMKRNEHMRALRQAQIPFTQALEEAKQSFLADTKNTDDETLIKTKGETMQISVDEAYKVFKDEMNAVNQEIDRQSALR